MLKQIVLGGLLALSAAGHAVAEDWSGFYAGVLAGVSAHQSVTRANTVTGEFVGGSATVLGGYRHSVGSLVVGGEAAFSPVSAEKTYKSGEVFSLGARVNAKAIVGLPVQRFMPYAAIGIAATSGKVTGGGLNGASSHIGFSVGAGVETKMSDQLSVRAEISRTEFGLGDYGPWFGQSVWVRPADTSVQLAVIYSF